MHAKRSPALIAPLLLVLGCGGSDAPARPSRDTCAGGACDAIPTGHAGNPCSIPADGQPEDVSTPTTVVGTGTAASCTGAAFVAAVATGGVITFDCGPAPVTIRLTQTARVFNRRAGVDVARVVIDGGGKVTLSGGGRVRILYQDTCDPAQVWTTSHCQDQPWPALSVQNLTFADGDSTGETFDGGGGGAIFARGGRLKVVNCRFFGNATDASGPDVGGGAIRALSQSGGLPVQIVNSTFGGAPGVENFASNGAGLSSIGVSWNVLNSRFGWNRAVGHGANPARSGTAGGGSGGAIYLDGNTFRLDLCGSLIEENSANEGGGAIFFVSNDLTGTMSIDSSTLQRNPNDYFQQPAIPPGVFFFGSGSPVVTNSTITP
jgi:hypothetical protein